MGGPYGALARLNAAMPQLRLQGTKPKVKWPGCSNHEVDPAALFSCLDFGEIRLLLASFELDSSLT